MKISYLHKVIYTIICLLLFEYIISSNNIFSENKVYVEEKSTDYSDPLNKQPLFDIGIGLKIGYLINVVKSVNFMTTSKNVNNYLSPGLIYSSYLTVNPNILSNFLISGEFGYNKIDVDSGINSKLTIFQFGLNFLYEHPLNNFLHLNFVVGSGGYVAQLKSDKPSKKETFYLPQFQSGLGISADIDYNYVIGFQALYKLYLSSGEPLSGLNVNLTTEYRFGADPKYHLNKYISKRVEIEPIFPALSNYYSNNQIGYIYIRNNLKYNIESAQAILEVDEYLNSPTVGKEIQNIPPGGIAKVPISAVFNQKVSTIYNEQKVSAVVTLKYKIDKLEDFVEDKLISSMTIMKYNSITWDVSKRVGAFITTNDPIINTLARSNLTVVQSIWDENILYNPLKNVKIAIAMWSVLTAQKIKYVKDPSNIAIIQNQKTSIDTIQFPRELLKTKSGDCDDFVVLYCSLLENLGVDTCFVTIPGHIFMMFDTGLTSATYKTVFGKDSLLYIDYNDHIWIPIETTMIGINSSFFKAIVEGSKLLNSNLKTREIIYVSESQTEFKPISFFKDDYKITNSQEEELRSLYTFNTEDFRSSLFNWIENLDKAKKHSDKEKLNNINMKLSVFARFHEIEKAEKYYKKSLRLKSDQVYPQIIMGNLYFEIENYQLAKKSFKKALKNKRNAVAAIVGLAKVYEKLEETDLFHQTINSLDEETKRTLFRSRTENSPDNKREKETDIYNQNTIFWDLK